MAQAKAQEMLTSARTLADIRKAVGKTQVEVAQALGVKQHAISQLEQRSDTYLSTFRRFLAGMGMQLELSVVTADGVRVELSEFRTAEAGTEAAAVSASVPAALAKTVAAKKTRSR
ncbi:MAG: XRE family transcriptional regulator [Rubrivivax sp.]